MIKSCTNFLNEKLGYSEEVSVLANFIWKKFKEGETKIDCKEFSKKNLSFPLEAIYLDVFKDPENNDAMSIYYDDEEYNINKSVLIDINKYYRPTIMSLEHEIKHLYDFIKNDTNFLKTKRSSIPFQNLEVGDNFTKTMRKLFLLAFLTFFTISCEKESTAPSLTPNTTTEMIEPKPTPVEPWMYEAGFVMPTLPAELNNPMLKAAGGNGNGNGGNGGGGNNPSVDNGIRIVWSDNQYGQSPDGPITLAEGEQLQLSVEFLEDSIPGAIVNWYTNDQQVAYVNWIGMLQWSWIDYWFYPRWGVHYGNVTVISAFIYRPKPNGNGWLAPYQDNVIVYVE